MVGKSKPLISYNQAQQMAYEFPTVTLTHLIAKYFTPYQTDPKPPVAMED